MGVDPMTVPKLFFDPLDWFWIVAGDEQRAYSSSVRSYVPIENSDPMRTTAIDSESSMIDVLRNSNVPPYHRVPKSTVLARLGEEKSTQAMSSASSWQLLRWNAPDNPAVNADDPEVIALIQAVGADPAVVLAPE